MGTTPGDLRRWTVYSRRQLTDAGIHPRLVSSPVLTRVLPGHYTRSDHPADLRAVALAAQRLIGGGAVVCAESAAELYRMRLPDRMTRAGGAAIHLRAMVGPAPRSTPLLVVRRKAPARSLLLHGVEISHPLVALQEIATRTSRRELVVAVDSVVADRFGTVSKIPLAEVQEYAAGATGRGASALRDAVALARERVWSPQETEVRLMLNDNGWDRPVLNHPVIDPATGVVHYVDLAYPERRIAIEYDGRDHVTDRERVKRDHRKSAALHAEAWTVIRIYSEDLHDPTDILDRLAHAWAIGSASRGSAGPPDGRRAVSRDPGERAGTDLLDGSPRVAPRSRAPR